MLNKVTLIGNLGSDPEIRIVGESRMVAHFSLATTEKWKTKEGEPKEKTTWHNCLAWSPLAEIVEKWVKKGQQIYLEGKILNSSYEQDGVTKYKSEIEVKELKLLGKRSESDTTAQPAPNNATAPSAGTSQAGSPPLTPSDDLPF